MTESTARLLTQKRELKILMNFIHRFHLKTAYTGCTLYGLRSSFLPVRKMLKGMISGCPLNNLIPEWNELLYLGNYKRAYHRLAKTSNFPEFTSRVCPGLCEKACTCGLNGDAVTTKENEKQLLNMLLNMVTLSLKSLLCAPEKSCRNRFRSFGTCSSGPS